MAIDTTRQLTLALCITYLVLLLSRMDGVEGLLRTWAWGTGGRKESESG